MIKYVLAFIFVGVSAFGQFPTHSNTGTFNATTNATGAFDAFSWQWMGYDDQYIAVTLLPTGYSKVGFRMCYPKRGTVYLESYDGIVSGGSNFTLSVSRTNLPPNGSYFVEFMGYVNEYTGMPSRVLATGQITIQNSLFQNTNQSSWVNPLAGTVIGPPYHILSALTNWPFTTSANTVSTNAVLEWISATSQVDRVYAASLTNGLSGDTSWQASTGTWNTVTGKLDGAATITYNGATSNLADNPSFDSSYVDYIVTQACIVTCIDGIPSDKGGVYLKSYDISGWEIYELGNMDVVNYQNSGKWYLWKSGSTPSWTNETISASPSGIYFPVNKATGTYSVVYTDAYPITNRITLGSASTNATTDFATAAQGVLASSALPTNGVTSIVYSNADNFNAATVGGYNAEQLTAQAGVYYVRGGSNGPIAGTKLALLETSALLPVFTNSANDVTNGQVIGAYSIPHSDLPLELITGVVKGYAHLDRSGTAADRTVQAVMCVIESNGIDEVICFTNAAGTPILFPRELAQVDFEIPITAAVSINNGSNRMVKFVFTALDGWNGTEDIISLSQDGYLTRFELPGPSVGIYETVISANTHYDLTTSAHGGIATAAQGAKADTAWQNPAIATNWTWVNDGRQIYLMSYTGPLDVIVPDTLDGLPVVNLGASIMEQPITSLSGANNIEAADSGLFSSSALTSVLLPKITALETGAFTGSSLLTTVIIPSVTRFGNSVLCLCPALTAVYFSGDAPAEVDATYFGSPNVTNYVTNPTATGWGTTWNGRPVVRLPLFGSGSNLTDITAAQVGAISNTQTGVTLGLASGTTVATATASNEPVSYAQWQGGLVGNLDYIMTASKLLIGVQPTGTTYSAICTGGTLAAAAFVTNAIGTNGQYTTGFGCTNTTFLEIGAQTINGELYACESDTGDQTIKVEIYRRDVASSNLAEWGDGGSTLTVPAGTTPVMIPFSVYVPAYSTNAAFNLFARIKRVGGSATSVRSLVIGTGAGYPTHFSLSVQQSVLLAPLTARVGALEATAITNGHASSVGISNSLTVLTNFNLLGGRIGVGTNVPGYPIDIVNGGNDGINIGASGSLPATAIRVSRKTAIGIASTGHMRFNGTEAGIIFTPANDNIIGMIITSNVFVGIGTNTPTQRLHVVGNALIASNLFSGPHFITGQSDTNQLRIVENVTQTANNSFEIRSSAGDTLVSSKGGNLDVSETIEAGNFLAANSTASSTVGAKYITAGPVGSDSVFVSAKLGTSSGNLAWIGHNTYLGSGGIGVLENTNNTAQVIQFSNRNGASLLQFGVLTSNTAVNSTYVQLDGGDESIRLYKNVTLSTNITVNGSIFVGSLSGKSKTNIVAGVFTNIFVNGILVD